MCFRHFSAGILPFSRLPAAILMLYLHHICMMLDECILVLFLNCLHYAPQIRISTGYLFSANESS